MPKLFPVVVRRVVQAGGGGCGGAEGLCVKDSLGSLEVNVLESETNATPASVEVFDIERTDAETIAAAVEALLAEIAGYGETSPSPVDVEALDITRTDAQANATPLDTVGDLELGTVEANAAPAQAHEFALEDLLGEANATPTDIVGNLELGTTEANTTPTHSAGDLEVTQAGDSNAAPTEATQQLTITTPDDPNATPTDARSETLRYWGSGSTTNVTGSSQTAMAPGNANGANNNTRATIKTNLSALDTTDPVWLETPTFNVPSSLTPTAKRLRVWFNVAAIAGAQLDVIKLQYDVGGGYVDFYTHAQTTERNHDDGSFTFDASALTMTQLSTIKLRAWYDASVVATPQTRVALDAWCLELEEDF